MGRERWSRLGNRCARVGGELVGWLVGWMDDEMAMAVVVYLDRKVKGRR